MRTTITTSRVKITIRRPGGKIECVYPASPMLMVSDRSYNDAIKATAAAGRGDIISREWEETVTPMTLHQQRDGLAEDISELRDLKYEARQRDFDRDIGMHESMTFDDGIDTLITELTTFDIDHPDVVAAKKQSQSRRDDQLIKSAMNA